MTVLSTTHNLNSFLKNVVSRTKRAKGALSTLIISRLWNFSIELKPSQFHFCFGSQGYILKLIANHQYCLESSSLKSYKTTVFSHVNVLSRIANGSHCVFLRGFFFKWPDYQILLWIFFLLPNTLWTAEPKTRQKTATCDRRKQAIVNTLGFFSFHADDVFNRIHNSDYQCLIYVL